MLGGGVGVGKVGVVLGIGSVCGVNTNTNSHTTQCQYRTITEQGPFRDVTNF